MTLADISEYYAGDLVAAEDRAWADDKHYVTYATELLPHLHPYGRKRVVEIGCGAGWVLAALPTSIPYLGVDRNPEFLHLANSRYGCENRQFICEDIRKLDASRVQADVVCCFAVLKHFGLHEWEAILARVLSMAPLAVFEMQVYPEDRDDGSDFHHTYITQARLEAAVAATGRKYRSDKVIYAGQLAGKLMQSKIVVAGD